MAPAPARAWPRAIILVDMDAFFAALEQRDNPDWQGRPLGITNGAQGTCLITCSYEARAFGVHTGMRLPEARLRCPGLIQVPARPERYAAASTAIMTALRTVTPDIEVFSVDEAFLDVTRCQRLLGPPEDIARRVRELVYETAGVTCSVGLSGDKTTAKYAAKLNKPDGLTVIPPWEARARLHAVPVTELCGINRGIGRFLAEHGVHRCGDMARLPISVLARRFGNPGRRIWYMAQGADPEPVLTREAPPKSIGHGKVMPPATRAREVILTFLLHMSQKVGARLRRHGMQAQSFFVGLRADAGWLGDKRRLVQPTDDSRTIAALARAVFSDYWRGEGVHQVQVTALDPAPADYQLSLFEPAPAQGEVNRVMDAVNDRYGEFALSPARLLQRSQMPNVISPAWRPYGHRETIGSDPGSGGDNAEGAEAFMPSWVQRRREIDNS